MIHHIFHFLCHVVKGLKNIAQYVPDDMGLRSNLFLFVLYK